MLEKKDIVLSCYLFQSVLAFGNFNTNHVTNKLHINIEPELTGLYRFLYRDTDRWKFMVWYERGSRETRAIRAKCSVSHHVSHGETQTRD